MLTVSLPGRSERWAPGGKWKARIPSAIPSRAMGRHRVRRVGMDFAARAGVAPSQGAAGGWSDGDRLAGEDARHHPLVPARSGQFAESVLAAMVRKPFYVAFHGMTRCLRSVRTHFHPVTATPPSPAEPLQCNTLAALLLVLNQSGGRRHSTRGKRSQISWEVLIPVG